METEDIVIRQTSIFEVLLLSKMNYMDLDIKKYIPQDFSPESRVWIYQSNRLLGIGEVIEADAILQEFTDSWKTHGQPNKGFAKVLFGQFVVIIADEQSHTVSGCSTDASVRVVKHLEALFHVNLFDRQLLAFVVKDKVQVVPMNQLNYAIENGFVTPDTLYFNNTVLTQMDLLDKWIIPVKESWLAKKLKLQVNS